MLSSKYIFLFLVYFFVTCGVNAQKWSQIKPIRNNVEPGHSRIIGGSEVVPHSSPYQAGLLINKSLFCGGALISTNYVITAAHCCEVIASVEAILGAHSIFNETESTQIVIPGDQVIIHQDYNPANYRNDICLIRLEKNVQLDENIQLIPLPPSNERTATYLDQIATALGWGLVYDTKFPSLKDLSPVLRAVNVSVINVTECGEYYYDSETNTDYVTPNNLCTSGYRNRGTCNGDSGGPLVLNGILVGLTSFGTDLCEVCSPSVYTKVASYLDWISKNSGIVIRQYNFL